MQIGLNSIYVARMKRLKGGREIIRGMRRIKCPSPIETGIGGAWVNIINTREACAKMQGTFDRTTGTINVQADDCKVLELKTPYLKKGFNTIVGYDLNGRMTNPNIRRR